MEDNIFSLTNFSMWRCTVTHLHPGHGSLDIQLTNDELKKRMKLQFHQVFYFGGWTKWQGANFRFATDAEYFEFARKYPAFNDVPDDELLHTGIFNISKLFICQSEDSGLINVMASGGRLLDKDGTEIVSRSVTEFP